MVRAAKSTQIVLVRASMMVAVIGLASTSHGVEPQAVPITHQPGVDTAVAAAQSLTGLAGSKTQAPPNGSSAECDSNSIPPALKTSVPACEKKITRPTVVNLNGDDEPACRNLPDPSYRQLVFLNTQALRLIATKARLVAARMSCLLGVRISEAEITDSLAKMDAMLCDDSGAGYRSFIVNCSYEQGQSASFDPNRPYGSKAIEGEPDFCGALEINPESLDKVAREKNVSDLAMVRANRQQFADTLVHENIHALTSYLRERFKNRGASTSAPPGTDGLSECSVGSLRGTIDLPACGPWFTRESLSLSPVAGLQLGSPGHDAGSYRPYPTSEAARQQITSAETELSRLNKLRRTPQVDADIAKWTERKAEYERLMPCALAFETNPNSYIRKELDSRKTPWSPECKERPSGKYRDEANARFLAFLITGGGLCEESDKYFFNNYPYPGGLRSAP